MSHSWRKCFQGQPLAEELNPSPNFTAVQILDVTREEGGATETRRVHVEGIQSRSQLPELSEGTVVRWIHIRTPDMDYDYLMNFILTRQEFSKEERVSVYKLLKQFQTDRQHHSSYGKYFEPASLQQTQLFEVEHQSQFTSVPYISLGQASSSILPLRCSVHPTLTLLQHHYLQEPVDLIAKRDSEQTCRKLAGSSSNAGLLVNNLWILILNKSTMITVAPIDGDRLWFDLKLSDQRKAQKPESSGPGLWETLDAFAIKLQKKIILAIEELEHVLQYQQRIKRSLPGFLINMAESSSSESGDGFLRHLSPIINPKWILKLQYRFSTLESFLAGNRARFEGYNALYGFEVSQEDEIQSESLYLSFYENVDHYLETFSKVRSKGSLPLLFPSNQVMLNRLWLDVKQQSQLFLSKLSEMDINAQVLAVSGLSKVDERRDIPTDVEHLMALAVRLLVPEDSRENTNSKISDIYSEYIARLQMETQKPPSKELSRNIYQVMEELDIIAGITKSQHKVLTDIQSVGPDSSKNPKFTATLDATFKKLQEFNLNLDEYQRTFSHLATQARFPQSDTYYLDRNSEGRQLSKPSP